MTIKRTYAPRPQATKWLPLGAIKPSGWIRAQMERDLEHGFVGHLDELIPDLIQNDDIYGADRLTGAVKSKDLGVVAKESHWDVQFLWWNSETQSNWLDGLMRTALLLENPRFVEKARARIDHLLATQDADGYLGIYAPDLRFNFSSENGELWAQASLFRVLLGWYEATDDARALAAVLRAVDVTMSAYPMGHSHPFDVCDDFAGVGHGLVFTDVLDCLYQLTGDDRYLTYAHWLFAEYSRQPLSQDDIQLPHLLVPDYRFNAHGVHTYEHIRSLSIATYATDDPQMDEALSAALAKLDTCLTPSGGPIGDEFIHGRLAHASETGYEYCSIQELLDTYSHLLQKTGAPQWGDRIEWLLFNAGHGARHPHQPAIAYLKTDNSFSMTGPLHPDDLQEAENPQTRYKYSPVHQDVAVCCVPNAGRIHPYYVRSMWLRSEGGLLATLYGACEVQTEINGVRVLIREGTEYPFGLDITLRIEVEQPVSFDLALRLPSWATAFQLTGIDSYAQKDGLIHIHQTWQSGHTVYLHFETEVSTRSWNDGEVFYSYGPLVYALPLPEEVRPGRGYPLVGFQDLYYVAQSNSQLIAHGSAAFIHEEHTYDLQHPWQSSSLAGNLLDGVTRQPCPVRLIPIGGSILRQVTFPKSE